METIFPIKRLFRIALYTSTIIGLITLGPVYVFAFSFRIINVNNTLLLKLICIAVFGITFLVFLFWVINIFLAYLIKKYSLSARIQLLSYIIGFLLFISVQFIVRHFFMNSSIEHKFLSWKIKEFGIHTDQISLLNYTPYLITVFMVFSVNSVVLIFHGLVLLVEKKTIIESENIQLKIRNIEATNQKLKQQLQPHFLFNSLNVLKTLIRKQPNEAEEYLMRLSNFLRASVSFDNANTVKVEDELNLSMDYLEMQKIRFGSALQFEVTIPEEAKSGILPIFSIQLLLENAIKHNAFTIESPLFINLFYQDGWITVSNNIRQKLSDTYPSGLGLLNLSERYKIISGDEINIQTSDTAFSVSIKILADENSNHRG
jgi:two-component system, LytTR family, sensor kinase